MKSSQKSDVVSRVRSALNMTQESFARELGCSLSNVQKMESEQRTPGTRALKINLAQLAKRAGVEVEASPDEKILEK
ncbi:MAG: XRE family transcriptional regulator [Proteobacteria bacterium]|nr:MAG: XRE family transcriptional regulator [Pseudomonadota bacterium]